MNYTYTRNIHELPKFSESYETDLCKASKKEGTDYF